MILSMMDQHLGPVFVDCTTRMAAYEATKIMIAYAAASTGENGADTKLQLKEDITFSMKVLSEQPCVLVIGRACRALPRLLHRFGSHEIVNSISIIPSSRPEGDPAEVSGPLEAFYLSDLAPFRRAFNDVNKSRNRRESATGSLASSQNLTQDAPPVRHWNQPMDQQPLDSSVIAGNQIMPMGDFTQVVGNMSNEITWDLFSLPDWLYQQQDMDFDA
ncbi:Regulator of drug sensitivity 1 [Fusarium austroafricanum]|uniref:Regulator of drug sensitivity 1 n=1 Tax=Fusarium austroafricanum TaxID=2364996 RepID=A0A8H4KKW7_9HYPO|nr:Regulator of drug sensitivity 1 [Fusarium austroafricanum]